MKPSSGCNLKGPKYTIGNALKVRDFILQYIILIKKCKRDLVIVRHCQLHIKALLSYSLKMAS
jgi:hypothetical protein